MYLTILVTVTVSDSESYNTKEHIDWREKGSESVLGGRCNGTRKGTSTSTRHGDFKFVCNVLVTSMATLTFPQRTSRSR